MKKNTKNEENRKTTVKLDEKVKEKKTRTRTKTQGENKEELKAKHTGYDIISDMF